ncbi:MAG TPA: superoxide dismutase family protein [Acidimicrobiales bacterium]|nr:superoxide dismutase family protein [Acidimicrobiales bacterium]
MRSNRLLPVVSLALAGALLAACGDDDDGEGADSAAQTTVTTAAPGTTAEMIGVDGASVGRVTFTEADGRLAVEGRFTNLPPGFHGFHVHAVGRCERGTPAFMSAGGHMVLGDQAHPVHAGDQPVLMVLADGTAEIRFTTDRYRLSDLQTAEGRAVIVHANPDNYANVPTRYVRQPDATTLSTGDAGDRIACGVVGGGGPATTAAPGAATTSTTPGRATSTTRATGAAMTLDCQTVAFTPNSEDAASQVKATGVTCAEAEAFVRVAGRRTSSGGPQSLSVEGYRCVLTRSVQDPIPQASYECTNGARKITFVRT